MNEHLDPQRTTEWIERNRTARGDVTTSTRLVLAEDQKADLERWAAEGYPKEVCGLLVGRVEEARVIIDRVVEAPNLNQERARDRYELDPQAFLTTDREAREAGLEILGIWHSHPDAPAMPSLTDLERAWEGYSYLIISVSGQGKTEARSWRVEGGVFLEEPLG